MTLAMWLTPLNTIPEGARFLSTVTVMVITAIIPLAMLITLMKLGRISDLDITTHTQRFFPVTIISLCYLFASFYIFNLHGPLWLMLFFISGFVQGLVFALISRWWKISGHSAGMGVLTALLIRLMVSHFTDMNLMVLLTVTIILSGIVGSARVVLGRHTLLQVYVGYILSIIITYSITGMSMQLYTLLTKYILA
jgi:membrane-associated phospholipid phosphatase